MIVRRGERASLPRSGGAIDARATEG
jgi:hypothetical protein